MITLFLVFWFGGLTGIALLGFFVGKQYDKGYEAGRKFGQRVGIAIGWLGRTEPLENIFFEEDKK